MLKQFTYGFFTLFFASSGLLADESPLCPKPDMTNQDNVETTNPDILHQYMLKANSSAANYDWVVDDNTDSACQGYYLEPANPNAQQSVVQKKADAFISANSVKTIDSNTLDLVGDVEMYKGSTRISCDKMRYFSDTQNAQINGNLKLREQGFLLQADSGSVSNNLKNAELLNASYLMHARSIRGTAKHISIMTDDNKEHMLMKKAMISSCPPNKNSWTLNASTLELDNKGGWGAAYNAIIRIEEVPVFYFPYINFPINDKRKTGFLFPILSVSSSDLDISTPYYLNLAENFDMTYSPRLQTEHALSHALETRYKNRWSEWQINGQYIDNDKKIGYETIRPINREDRNRWAYGLKESGALNRYFRTRINYQRVSDNDFFQDWGSQGLDITKTLNIRRDAALDFNNQHWQVSANLVDYQTLEENPDQKLLYRQLPRIDMQYNHFGKPFSLNPTFDAQYVNFQHKEDLVESNRFHIEPGLSYSMLWPAFSTTGNLTYKRTDFLLSDNQDTNPRYEKEGKEAISVPTFSIDSQLFFERSAKHFTQTLVPRLFYYYAQYQDQDRLPSFDTIENTFSWQQLFRGERFNGYDRISDANQLTVALTSEFLNKHDGRIMADIGIGQILYFRDRKVSLDAGSRQLFAINDSMSNDKQAFYQALNNERKRKYYNGTSDIATQVNWYLNRNQKISSNMLIDSYLGEFQEASLGYQWRTNNRHILNLGYRYVKNEPRILDNSSGDPVLLSSDINEVDFSIIWPFSNQWSGMYRYQYDITRKEQADNIIGLTYDNCCLKVMLAYQKERRTFDEGEWAKNNFRSDYNDQYMIEFTLKGLGTINSSITRLLHQSIPGFRRD